MKKLGPVDQYTGGAEHAVMHLLYARFFTKAMRDLGLLDFDEPFLRLFNQGHIIYQSQKMSKSRGNVVSPDEYVAKYGADSIRCYLMFLGPWDQGGEWSDSGLNGVVRWINRLYEIVLRNQSVLEQNIRSAESEQSLNRTLHQTIKRVSEDLEKFKFNTAIAALMEFTNALNSHWNNKQIGCDAWTDSIRNLVLMLAPFAPHLAEELWGEISNDYSIHSKSFPKWNPEFVKEDTFNLVIQINGKVRDKVLVDATIDESQAKEIALSRDNIFKYVDGKSIKSCTAFAADLDGSKITTIEGLAQNGKMHPMQEAFKKMHGLQCGFCTPGMVMSAIDLLKNNKNPSDAENTDSLEGNICLSLIHI